MLVDAVVLGSTDALLTPVIANSITRTGHHSDLGGS